MANVSLRHVCKTFDSGVAAVRDCTLEVADGELLVVAGPDGSGKSTLLRMIAGLEKPDEGEIYIGNAAANRLSPQERDIAMVLQNNALYPELTVAENMAFSLKMRRMPEKAIEERVREVAVLLNMEALLDRKPGALSAGQQQKVALARAMMRGRKVLLMDEPLANLDEKLRLQMRDEFCRLHQQLGMAVIYATKDQGEAMALGDRIVVMKDGFVQQTGTPVDLYGAPVNQFVAGFLGEPSMNFINVKIGADGVDYTFTFGKSVVRLPKTADKADVLKNYLGKNAVLGVRPEDVHDDPAFVEKNPNGAVDAEVEVTELSGGKGVLYLACSGHSITACVEPDANRQSGEKIKIALDMEKIYLFDGDTERTVLRPCAV